MNFHLKPNPEKSNAKFSGKCKKPWYLAALSLFYQFLGKNEFSQKFKLCQFLDL